MFSVDDIQQNVPLSSFATFRIGGAAKYFLVVKTREELIKAVKWARENDLSYFVLGGGSNILISEKGFSGLVIKNESNGLKIGEMEDGKLKVKCDSGVMTAKIVFETTKLGYSGAEWGFGIPGTIGGAIGSFVPIPGGAIIGSMLGNLVGGLVGGKPSGFLYYVR